MDNFLSPMLASDYKPELLKFPLLGSAKLDGIRAVVDRIGTPSDGMFTAYARSGLMIKNRFIQKCIGRGDMYGFDGELVVGAANAPDVYNRTSSGVMSINGEPDFTYWVFDRRHMDAIFTHRYDALTLAVRELGSERVRILPQEWLMDMAALEAFESKCLGLGFEGIMLRDPESMYKYGRSTARGRELLKVKRVSHDEGEIIGFVEQMHNDNEAFADELGRTKRSSAKDGLVPADTLGAFICRNNSKWELDFNVAPGILTHAERKELWDRRDSWLGRTITFKHLAHGAKDRPRHGRYNGVRDPSDLS